MNPLRIPPTGSSSPLATSHLTPRPAYCHSLEVFCSAYAEPLIYLFGLPEKSPGTMNRKEAVESLGTLMGLKGLGTRWVIRKPECWAGDGGPQRCLPSLLRSREEGV